ncbi:MAG: LemA family protein [Bacilli bacterium]
MDKYILTNIILIIIIIVIGAILIGYNRLVQKRNVVKRAKAQIDVVLNKRFDLIPNIVNCVKGYAKYESDTLEDVVKARNTYKNGNHSLKDANEVNNKLNQVIALAEAYPDLKANTEFNNLQQELSNIEDEIANYRKAFNNAVTSYNTMIESVPTNIIAGLFNFKQMELFRLEEDKKSDVKIEL